MNLFERLGVKVAWKRMEGKMPALKRYGPLLGSTVLAAVVILRLFGQNDAASAVESVGGVIGVTGQSPVGVGELTAAAVAITGVVLKIRAEIKKAKTP